jgi:two-component system, chemotaxis family, sensor kinase CheA
MLDETSMAALLQTFLAECEEGLLTAEEALLVLERDQDDVEALALVFRAVHTIKGNAGLFDFHALAAVAHAMEDLLDRVRAGQTSASRSVVSSLLDAVDVLHTLLFEEDRTREITPAAQELIARLRSGIYDARSADTSSRPLTQQLKQTLRIDVNRLNRLLDLSGEIGVARGIVEQMLETPSISRRLVLEAQRDADRLHLEMQELVMKLRMVPVGPAFRQLQRVVRDAAQSVSKEAELRIEGGDVEVDMTIIEHLRDPLTHMIRNSVGHGIESLDERRAAGKPLMGQLLLRSFHDSGSIVIELSDDGAGIDHKRVAERARQQGLFAEAQNLSESETLELIFHPGFSTASSVTGLSGRGVGLDVVRRNIDAVHGSVTVESRPGEGTTFRLRLPLTLAIVDGLRIGIAGESFIIPMGSVIEALRFPSGGDATAATGVMTHRGESIPFVRLRKRLSHAGGSSVREDVVIVRYARGRAGLVVDDLHGECQTVIKPLAGSLRGIPGLSGSAILPNGGIAFILDVPALLQIEIDRSRTPFRSQSDSNQEKSCFVN